MRFLPRTLNLPANQNYPCNYCTTNKNKTQANFKEILENFQEICPFFVPKRILASYNKTQDNRLNQQNKGYS
jgi:hypothetical protein